MRLHNVTDYVTRDRPEPDPTRSGGIHVSSLVQRLATKLGHLDPQDWDEGSTLRVALGQAWEDRLGPQLERALPCFCYHPGEMTLDGIAGNADGEEIADDGLVIHEIKATWISLSNKKLQKREGLIPWYIEKQIMSYCKMAGTRRAVLHRLYVNGSYRPPIPYYWALGLEFTQEELDRSWDQMLVEAFKLKAEQKSQRKRRQRR